MCLEAPHITTIDLSTVKACQQWQQLQHIEQMTHNDYRHILTIYYTHT